MILLTALHIANNKCNQIDEAALGGLQKTVNQYHMASFNLDTELMQFGEGDASSQKSWTIRQSVTGVQCFGANGSGKSSSMKTLALKDLRAGYGFLVLSVKPERETWREYCRLAGRSSDFITIGERSQHRFDFMAHLSQQSGGTALTSNLLHILTEVIKTMDEMEGAKSSDPFWDKSLRLLLHSTIALNQLADDGRVSIQGMYDLIQSAPQGSDDEEAMAKKEVDPEGAFGKAITRARAKVNVQYQAWKETWNEDKKNWFKDRSQLEAEFLNKVPDARRLKFVEQFFFETFKTLSFKTKSIILLSVSSFLFDLLQEPIYSLFCNGTTVTPEDCLKGKVLVLDLPTKHYHRAGRSAQQLFKMIAQLEWEKRNVEKNPRPCALWIDESAEFLTDFDTSFQATSRSSKIALVYICQNMHQYLSALSGPKSADRVASFLAVMGTKLYFSNSDPSTNKTASELFGDGVFFDPARTITIAEKFSQTDSVSLKIDRLVRPEAFTKLACGGTENGCRVEAYIHVQGTPLFNGRNFKKIRFNQNYK